ncbi:MAG: SCO family protein, partial [Magnetococcales bacterium]|nr:SCO family protein [Magnetococcales bacterium]
GATGDADEIAGLAAQVWAQYNIGEEDTDGNYDVEHTAAFFLIDPKGRLFAVFPTEFHRKPQQIAKAFSLMRQLER